MKKILLALLLATQAFSADSYERLQVGKDVYHRVVVLSVSESSLSIRHARGIAQVPLEKLSDELKEKYGYDSHSAALREKELEALRQQQAEAQRARITAARKQNATASAAASKSGSAFALFGTEPRLQTEVDLRDRFRSHGIRIRSQSGPSCSVHAIVAALEYQYAERYGRVLNLSENYLVATTSRSLGRPDEVGFDTTTGKPKGWDAGFALEHVFQAIRGHGLALEQSREEFAEKKEFTKLDDIAFSPFLVPGAGTPKGIENLVHVLNSNMPVVVGVAWPAYSRIAHTSLLSKQPSRPGEGHAVTIIGYRCEDGTLEGIKFIFRNSWGDDWGAGGYGFFSYDYLMENLRSSYVVELK